VRRGELAEQLTGLAADELRFQMLETFPNTTMTAGHLPGPRWVAPAVVRRATAFIDAHAGEPVTAQEIAAAAPASSLPPIGSGSACRRATP
jgi:hypothetical protein